MHTSGCVAMHALLEQVVQPVEYRYRLGPIHFKTIKGTTNEL